MESYDVKVTGVRYPKEDDDRKKRDAGEVKQWYILECDFAAAGGSMTAKGEMIFRPVVGEHLRITGTWKPYNGQRQFEFKSAEVNMPVSERDMLRYACELTAGFGPATEEAIWEKHGEAWRDIEAKEIRGLTAGKVAAFRATIESLKLKAAQHNATAWLMSKGATPAMAAAAWLLWGADMVGVVTANCYRLTELPNYGFTAVDKEVRRHFDIGDNDPRRLEAAILYCMGQLTEDGNTAISWPELDSELSRRLGGVDRGLIVKIIMQMFADNRMYGFAERQMLAMGAQFRAEQDIFAFCREVAQ